MADAVQASYLSTYPTVIGQKDSLMDDGGHW
jgi:hypothetical protein